MTNHQIINIAHQLGFELVGFSKAEKLKTEIEHLQTWLQKNFQAGMSYMERNFEKREDVSQILPNAKSVISLGLNYYTDTEHNNRDGFGKVSRYAWGKDYHLIIWEKLDQFVEMCKEIDSHFEAKTYIDTGPVMDKAWAVKSGIGWMGKHTNVISREIGSWFFIANVITNFEFDYNEPIADFCGSCTACIVACPTNAIVDEYVVDANKCISYLTIESKSDVPEEFISKFDNWIFGCDICQDVCPWNHKFSLNTDEKEFLPRETELNISEIKNMTNSEFKKKFSDSPISRPRLKGMKRNAEFLEK
ncbi:MAG: tRNA epoxyqueuosine(34) reductase QueG [Melioribacteraceae bacterium]|jgi:epoxyqueuosine reductase|nr:MAG: tRNA epoxyqueuosine(34) reductase QueG [Ignavibacteriales bacterium]WKZ68694.1 MAG: tRNA epoxyqueuosine(34) reductase QueG [Melioribacteraceae bacterium]